MKYRARLKKRSCSIIKVYEDGWTPQDDDMVKWLSGYNHCEAINV